MSMDNKLKNRAVPSTHFKFGCYSRCSTQLDAHLWTQVLKHLSVHIYLVTSVYQILQST